MSTIDDFLRLFDADGRFRTGDGTVGVVFLTNAGHRYPGSLVFKDGLCVSADMEGSPPWVYPDNSPLTGLRLLLAFDDPDPLVILINEGRLTTSDALQFDARLAEAFSQTERFGVAISQRARTALLSLSVSEQIAVLEAVARLAKRPVAEWLQDGVSLLADDKPIYLLKVSDDLRAFIRVLDGGQQEQVELFDIVREATLQAFLERSPVKSGAK